MLCYFVSCAALADADHGVSADALWVENSWFNTRVMRSREFTEHSSHSATEALCLHLPLRQLKSPLPLPLLGEQSEFVLCDITGMDGRTNDGNSLAYIEARSSRFDLVTGRERFLTKAEGASVPESQRLPKPYIIRGWRPDRRWSITERFQCDPAGPVIYVFWIIVPRLREMIWYSYRVEFREDFQDDLGIGLTWETPQPRLFGASEIEVLVQFVDEPICDMPDAVQVP